MVEPSVSAAKALQAVRDRGQVVQLRSRAVTRTGGGVAVADGMRWC